jgi:RNA polymerase sigma-70 factor (ECF subfamily)
MQALHAKASSRTDHELTNELFAANYQGALGTAYRILRSWADSEDAVQTAYLSAFRHLDAFRGEASFKTWITRIVVNCCLMKIRERRARMLVEFDNVQISLPAFASRANNPEALCAQKELQAAHARATSALTPAMRDVYCACAITGTALPKVARELGLTTAAAKSRLFRARKIVERGMRSAVRKGRP